MIKPNKIKYSKVKDLTKEGAELLNTGLIGWGASVGASSLLVPTSTGGLPGVSTGMVLGLGAPFV